VILELTRSKADPKKGGPEILDIDALMALEQTDLTSFAELSNKEKKLRDLERNPNNIICNRCFHLKHFHERLE